MKQSLQTIRLAQAALSAHHKPRAEGEPRKVPEEIQSYGHVDQWKKEPAEWVTRVESDLKIARKAEKGAKAFLNATSHVPVLFYSLVCCAHYSLTVVMLSYIIHCRG